MKKGPSMHPASLSSQHLFKKLFFLAVLLTLPFILLFICFSEALVLFMLFEHTLHLLEELPLNYPVSSH